MSGARIISIRISKQNMPQFMGEDSEDRGLRGVRRRSSLVERRQQLRAGLCIPKLHALIMASARRGSQHSVGPASRTHSEQGIVSKSRLVRRVDLTATVALPP
jgi:hypothetical protein